MASTEPRHDGPCGAKRATTRARVLTYLAEHHGVKSADITEETGVGYTMIRNLRRAGWIDSTSASSRFSPLRVSDIGARWLAGCAKEDA